MWKAISLISGFLALLLSSGTACANEAAAALFDEALGLRAAGKLNEACQLFEKSQALDPSPGTLLNVADCRAAQGRVATAWKMFQAAAELGKARGRADVVREATLRAAELGPRVPTLSVHVTPLEGMRIEWDGVLLRDARWDRPVSVDPGVHVLRVSAPGFEPRSLPVTVAPGASHQQIVVPVLTRPAPPSVRVSQPPAEQAAAPPREVESDLPVAFIAAGALFTTAGFLTQGFLAGCVDDCGLLEEREDLTSVAHVFWGAAAVSVAIGLSVSILKDDTASGGPSVSLTTGCGQARCGAKLRGFF